MPDEYRLKEIGEDYHNMSEMFFGRYPTFEEVMDKISDMEKEIHEL